MRAELRGAPSPPRRGTAGDRRLCRPLSPIRQTHTDLFFTRLLVLLPLMLLLLLQYLRSYDSTRSRRHRATHAHTSELSKRINLSLSLVRWSPPRRIARFRLARLSYVRDGRDERGGDGRDPGWRYPDGRSPCCEYYPSLSACCPIHAHRGVVRVFAGVYCVQCTPGRRTACESQRCSSSLYSPFFMSAEDSLPTSGPEGFRNGRASSLGSLRWGRVERFM